MIYNIIHLYTDKWMTIDKWQSKIAVWRYGILVELFINGTKQNDYSEIGFVHFAGIILLDIVVYFFVAYKCVTYTQASMFLTIDFGNNISVALSQPQTLAP